MQHIVSKTVLFITGAFIHNSCWDEWMDFFEKKGFKTSAPAWLYKDAPPELLRERHPDSEVASIRLSQLIAHYEKIVKASAEKPILIGHSIGGLIAQVMVDRGLAAAAIVIHSVPPQGVFVFRLSLLKAGWGPLGFFTSTKRTFMMSFSQWQYAFSNGMPTEWQEKGYCLAIPESKQVVRDTISSAARVDMSKPHVPLLFIAGEKDHSIPAALNQANYKKYSDTSSVTDFKQFDGRNHFVLGQPGWQEVATYISDWINHLHR